MAFCRSCGAQLQDGVRFCPACGTAANVNEPQQQTQQPSHSDQLHFTPAEDTNRFDPQDIEKNKIMAILAYFGVLVLVPVFTARDSKFARFHANQGLILLVAYVAYGIVYGILRSIFTAIHLSFISKILGLVYILFLVLAIIGIVNAAGGKAKELPVIGKYRILN